MLPLIENLSIKNKLIIGIITPLLLTFTVIIILTYRSNYNSIIKYSQSVSIKEVNKISKVFTNYTLVVNTIKNAFNNKDFINIDQKRTFFNLFLKDILETNTNLFGIWATFEKDKFDGLDKKFIGNKHSTLTGNFSPYWIRRDGNIIQIQSNDVDKNSSDFDFYNIPFKTQKLYVTNPYIDPDTKILMTSISNPVIENNETIGVVGVDFSLNELSDIVNSIKPFDGSFAFIANNIGKLVIYKNFDLIGKNIKDIPNFLDDNSYNILLKNLNTNKSFQTEIETANGDYLVFSSRILIEKNKLDWNLIFFVPKDKLLTDLYVIMWIMVGILIILIFIIWFIAENISKSILKTFIRIKQLSEGVF